MYCTFAIHYVLAHRYIKKNNVCTNHFSAVHALKANSRLTMASAATTSMATPCERNETSERASE